MNVDVLALCDAATDQQGKLNILGAFDTIFAKEVPWMHPQCSVALRLRFQRIEEGKHKIRIHLVDEDGNLIIPSLDADLQVKLPANQDSASVNMVLNLQRLKLEHYGTYAANLAVDGRQEGSIPLYVKEPPQRGDQEERK
jgi:hypothetical protein